MDIRKTNDACLHDPFLTPFTDELIENVGGREAYYFIDGFSGYHQIKISQEEVAKLHLRWNGEVTSIQYCYMTMNLCIILMHCLCPYVITHAIETGVVQLKTLNREFLRRIVNGSRLKPYKEG
jgi:hypothetical protein